MRNILVEHEDFVFDLIKEYLNENRVFNMKKIIPYLNSRIIRSHLNINNEGIQKILTSLIKKKKNNYNVHVQISKENVSNYSRR